ncbi:WcbI family polysaccharide biosynthesis putative acetyltransferase [Gluconacetobacter sp. Hr-1-5]|uniref:WcbI family polysaccharide biosynthesis putative acetyltransferase n=1 Tax=Gluconacetobacter sp. Hr-1-5 TaxID=3395370 RepID=UPI003B5252D4
MPTIAVIGNCQAQAIEAIIAMHTDCKILRLPPVFEMSDADKDRTLDVLGKVDVIFAQRVSADYNPPFLRAASLRSMFPNVLIWPNIYHAGYSPDIEYLYLGGIGKVVGPLDDYHMKTVRTAYLRGASVAECLSCYSVENFTSIFPNPIEASLAELRRREKDVDIKISDCIEEYGKGRKLFYTPNHPVNVLLFEMVRRMLYGIGLNFDNPPSHPYTLSKINVPVYSAVRRHYGLDNLAEGSFVGIDRLDYTNSSDTSSTRVYEDLEDLVNVFYRFYDTVPGFRELQA